MKNGWVKTMTFKKKVPLKESRIDIIAFLLILMGALCSVLPDGSWLLFGLNMTIAVIACITSFILWRYNRSDSVRYFSLNAYVMLVALAIYFAIPLFRVFTGTIVFWAGLLVIIIMASVPYLFAENIASGVKNPTRTALGRVYMVTVPLIITFGSILFTNVRASDKPSAVPIAIFLYVGALFFLFIAPILLITPERMEELEK